VLEDRTASFGVRLGWQPASDVSVAVSSPLGDGDLSVTSANTLVFTSANWSVYQTVTVAAAPDDDASNGQAVVQCVSVDVPVSEVAVTEQDDDTLGIVTEADSLDVLEGTTGLLRVRLGAAPEGVVEVAVGRVSGDADLEVSSGSILSFDASNWNSLQTATIAAAPDADVVGGQAMFRCSASGLPAVDVAVSESDADVLAIELDRAGIAVPEGETATFSVRLSNLPTQDVTVTVARSGGDSDIAVATGASLVFTPSNWQDYQEVVLQAGDDADLLDGTAAIRCTAPGLANVTITAVEQDMEVSPAEPAAPSTTSSGSGGQVAAPGCGAGVGGAILACCAVGLMFRQVRGSERRRR
jgi:cellulose 1,4-beta-cellobiosidase